MSLHEREQNEHGSTRAARRFNVGFRDREQGEPPCSTDPDYMRGYNMARYMPGAAYEGSLVRWERS